MATITPTPPEVRERFRVHGVKSLPAERAPSDEPDGPPPWLPLGLGVVAAFVLHALLPCTFSWFLAAIPHEMGHATVGCLLGRPSAPAISLAGHAWTGIGDLQPLLVWLQVTALAGGAIHLRRRRGIAAALAAAAVVLPLVAFTGLASILISAAGHLGEIAFAAYCYALCWRGGYTGTLHERIASAAAGAMLQFGTLRLCFGLLSDAAARAHYETSGSLGMKNDMLVLAEDLCHCRLQSVALPMFVLALAALPLGVLGAWWANRHGARCAD